MVTVTSGLDPYGIVVTRMVWVMIKLLISLTIHIQEPKHNLATYD